MIKLLSLKIYIKSFSLRHRNMRNIAHVVRHGSVLVDGVQSAFHKLATFKQVVDVISKYSLAVSITLDLEHELSAGHTIRNLESLV